MGGGLIRSEPNALFIVSQRTRHIARLAQVPFGFAQGRLSPRKERLLRMTNMVWTGRAACIIIFAWHSPFESVLSAQKNSS